MMDMHSRNQYLQTLIKQKGYHLRSRKEKSKLIDEYCSITGQHRKHVIRKIRSRAYTKQSSEKRQTRRQYYDGRVRAALATCWKIFDHPCGQRLEPLLKDELDRLRKLGELVCSDEAALKLKKISPRTIDEKLRHQKEVERLRRKYQKKKNPLLYQKIPVKLSDEWNRNELGNVQLDLVEHCGQSARGDYVNTLAATDIATGWWEGEAVMSKGQEAVFEGLKQERERFPFLWRGIHSDNGTEFINWHLYKYTQQEKLNFSRSRPYKKNDNCFVEQKNWTHVKKFVGYLRYDTYEELDILNDLYRNELRLFKNFFQTTIKLKEKTRIGGRIKRVYEKTPKTPYQRVMESNQVSKKAKKELKELYESLNPAELKREIERKLNLLYKAYQKKQSRQQKVESDSTRVDAGKRLKPISVTFLTAEPRPVSVT